ncbi:hypothetical protein MMC26_004853 [Xylographa opegraphella]|nr:hypothetical protein [Xylographa opegraphella]
MVAQLNEKSCASLQVISYADLVSCNNEALLRLYSAAIDDGFFYLDLTGTACPTILPDVADLMTASADLFELPLSEKMKFDTNKLGLLKNYGYKPIGRNTGVTEGKKDGHELYLIPRDILFGLDPSGGTFSCPATLRKHDSLLKRFTTESHEICSMILASLSTTLGQNCLTQQHRHDQLSTSTLALLKYPSQLLSEEPTGHIAHTDVGSLTLLFCNQGGLQVLHPALDHWIDIPPMPGHAVVNIGDSLRHLSHRRLKSCLHRVMPHSSDKAEGRYSIVYFLRPELEATFVDETGREWKSVEWHTRKFDAFRHGDARQVEGILKGGF